jgi:hypothetical protein
MLADIFRSSQFLEIELRWISLCFAMPDGWFFVHTGVYREFFEARRHFLDQNQSIVDGR